MIAQALSTADADDYDELATAFRSLQRMLAAGEAAEP
jgi:hypothetical protein